MSATYRAKVYRVDARGIFVTVPTLGGGVYGPLEVLVDDPDNVPSYAVGDRVLVQQVGPVKEDLLVLGHAKRHDGSGGVGQGGGTLPAPGATDNLLTVIAGAWGSAALTAAKIPSLDASKIVSGTFDVSRIPNLDVSRIPNLDTAKITTGRFGYDRLPLPTDIPNAADLNTYTTEGVYHQDSDMEAIMGTNYPIAYAGLLEVRGYGSGAYVYQRYTSSQASGSRVFTRTYSSSTWSSWYEDSRPGHGHASADITSGTLDAARIPTLDAAKVGTGRFPVDRLPLPTDIPSGENLNMYTTGGHYYQATLGGAAAGSNYPEASAGTLEVVNASSGAFVYQRYITVGGNKVYFRAYSSSTWSSWTEIGTSSSVTNLAFFRAVGASTSLGASFAAITTESVVTNIGGGSYSSGLYTVPFAGIYIVTATLRVPDLASANSFGHGVDTANDDNQHFQWNDAGDDQRLRLVMSRVLYVSAGAQIRHYGYASSSLSISNSALEIVGIPQQILFGANDPNFILCTSTTRPAHQAGLRIFETDTKRQGVSDGTYWTLTRPDAFCMRYQNTEQSLAHQAWSTLTNLGTPDGLNWSGTSTIVVPWAGVYRISGVVTVANSGYNMEIQGEIFYNSANAWSSRVADAEPLGSSLPFASPIGPRVVTCSANDTFSLVVWHWNSGSTARNTIVDGSRRSMLLVEYLYTRTT